MGKPLIAHILTQGDQNVASRGDDPGRAWRASLPSASYWGVAVLGTGLALRLWDFDRSLWLDEFGTLWTVEGTPAEAWQRATTFQGQTPLYYLLAWASVALLGESETALRLVSLLAVLVATGLLWLVGREVGGSRAGWLGAGFFWLCSPAIAASVDARPYGLAMLATAVALLGFVRACTRGDARGRALWILGAAALVWTHFVEALILLGLGTAYLLAPGLRQKYRPRAFINDCVIVGALTMWTLPQLLNLTARRDVLSWIESPRHGEVAFLLAPFVVSVVGGWTARNIAPDRRALLFALLAAPLCHLVALELLWMAGVNLLVPRYMLVAVVPAAVAAGIALVGRPRAAIAPGVAAYAILTAIGYLGNPWVIGALAPEGRQGWRTAVSVLAAPLSARPGTPLLLRSGFVEQDLNVAGQFVEATRAPLRQPGLSAPPWRVVDLTYRWNIPGRETYFSAVVAAALDDADQFYYLNFRAGDGAAYTSAFIRWINQRWPAEYRTSSIEVGGGIDLLHFQRRGDPP